MFFPMRIKKRLMTGLIFFAITMVCVGGPIEDLKPGEWYEVPNSHLKTVAPSGVEPRVIDPWSGGAFDTKWDNLIVWGGGHGDYSGNEIYLFSLDSLKWTRVTNPSNPPAVDVPYASDGGPCSRHTYDYIQYLASIDRFCSFVRISSNGSPLSGEIRINLASDLPRGRLAVFDARGKQVADLTDRISVVFWRPDVRPGVYLVRLSLGKGPGAVKQVLL